MTPVEHIILAHINVGDTETTGRIARFDAFMDTLLSAIPGDIIEIGAGNGDSTIVFLKAAKNHDRKVLVIDPFESGWYSMPESYGNPYPHHLFSGRVYLYADTLDLCKELSNTKRAYDAMVQHTNAAFMFIDGGQLEVQSLYDMILAEQNEAQVICVDDIHRSTEHSQVPQALKAFLERGTYRLLDTGRKTIEGYLIKAYEQ